MATWTKLWIGVALVTLTPVEAAACSCFIPTPTPCPSLAPPAVVFVGTVMDIENPPADHPSVNDTGLSRYRFRVDEKFAGVNTKPKIREPGFGREPYQGRERIESPEPG